jgi:hypothetical protein
MWVSRRDWVRLSAAGLALPQLLHADTQRRRKASADACILLFLHGGMSHLDTVDLKPNAPSGIRSLFTPIATRTPGLHFCEHLPLLANRTDRFAVVRSMTHRASNHNPGTYYTLTGVPPSRDVVALATSGDDFPHPGAVVSKWAPTSKPVPTFVQLSEPVVGDGRTQVPGQSAGFLSAAYDPLRVTADPTAADFRVEELALPPGLSAARFQRRRDLLATVEAEFPLQKQVPELSKMDQYYQRAYQMVTAPAARDAFDLSKERPATRDRYGRFRHGQALLVARRLVEAGVRLVSVYWGGLLNAPDDYWDTHKQNFPKQKDVLLPAFDQCWSALLDDLRERGLLERTLVLALGEFGRTPKIGAVTANNGTDGTGRDHWPQCYSLLLAGGGVRGGAVVGKSDPIGAFVAERPTAPEDIIATIYSALGVDWTAEMHDRLGRPLPLTRGQPVQELFG